MRRMFNPRRMTAYRVAAILFALLGIGNILVGRARLNYYQTEHETLSAAAQNPSHKDISHLNQLKSRVGFYQLVQSGGILFILVAAGILIAEQVSSRGDS